MQVEEKRQEEQKKHSPRAQQFALRKLLYKGNIYKSIDNLINEKRYRILQNGKIDKVYSPNKQQQSNKPFVLLSTGVVDSQTQKQIIVKDSKFMFKAEIPKIKIQFTKQLRKQKGRIKLSSLEYFSRLKKKQHNDITVEAKTILPTIKEKLMKLDKSQKQISEIVTEEQIFTRKQLQKGKRESSLILVSNKFLTTDTHKLPQLDKRQSLISVERRLNKSQLRKPSHRKNQKSDNIILQLQQKQDNEQTLFLPQIQESLKESIQQNAKPYLQTLQKLRKRRQSKQNFFITKKDKDERLERYRQFLFKINFSNGIYIDLSTQETPLKLYYYLGKGNNSLLIKSLMKRRYWWVQGTLEQANFVWTQLKKMQIFQRQNAAKNSKLQTIEISNRNSDLWRPSKGQKTENNQKILYPSQNLMYISNSGNPMKSLKKCRPQLTHNHLTGNCHLGNKKALFLNLRQYCRMTKKELFEIIPLTFHVGNQYKDFLRQFKRRQKCIREKEPISNIWIVKPGENSNRGNGIHVIQNVRELDQILANNKLHSNGQLKTYIVQLYMHKPFLYNRRKFDIRHYMLLTNNGIIRAYWYKEGYIRTSSNIFDLEDVSNNQVHLTNDAIQKYSESYGKYQQGNKLSYNQFQRYLDNHYKEKKYNFVNVLQKMKQIATEAVKATFMKLDQTNKLFNFQIFGLDFMLDDNLKPWLIEINTNPCLQISSNLLGRIIPGMVQHAFRISLDPLYPPPNQYPSGQRHNLPDKVHDFLKFEMMFSSQIDGKPLKQMYTKNIQSIEFGDIQQENEQYQDEGHQINFVQ